jgi:two-component system, chemotaxis family, CheB/CheR fusion protein
MTETAERSDFERLLEFVRTERNFDFTGYKRSSLERRTTKRMQELGIERYADYLDYLQAETDEFNRLFNTILINVTSFFRDEETWAAIGETILPELLERDGQIRIWSAGCASGQEPFSIAMLLAERLGAEDVARRVKIYATDIDEEALTEARRAEYSDRAIRSVPPALLERYFDLTGQRYSMLKELRRAVIFGRHNLAVDAPISKIDLLLCRNTLMYFSSPLQTYILDGFHFALAPDRYLVLGKSEVMLSRTDRFVPVDLKRRIFRADGAGQRYHGPRRMAPRPNADDRPKPPDRALETRAFDTGQLPQLLLDAAGVVTFVNERARKLFELKGDEVGRPIQDLEISYRPVELRSLIERAAAEQRPIAAERAEWARGDASVFIDVHVVPLLSDAGALLGTGITFHDVTGYHDLEDRLRRSQREVEMAYEELQSTVEELETTNEELQSTNEELETTNEELQSTNEELETMNEELQSTNEELETMNEELRRRSLELNELNIFFESVLLSVRVAVIVVDPALRVLVWNREASDLWGLRSDEVEGQHLLNLDIGFPVDRLRDPVKACLSGESRRETLTAEAMNRRGRTVTCQVACTPLGRKDDVHGAVILMEQVERPEPSGGS